MEVYKRRLVSVVPNTDETFFAVYECFDSMDDANPTLQFKVRIKFIAFYEQKWNEESEWEVISVPLTNYEGSIDSIEPACDSCGFLGYLGSVEEITMDESEYLPFKKRKETPEKS